MSRILRVAEEDGIIYLRVPEPIRLGDSSDLLAWELVDACAEVEQRDVPPTAVALISAGRAFCVEPVAGAADCDRAGGFWAQATAAIGRLGTPTVAAIGGDAMGPAWELALACDLRIATAEVRVGSPEIRWGRLPASGGTQRLLRIVGPATALRLLLLGEALDARAAQVAGLVHRVAAEGELEVVLDELLGQLRLGAPVALAYAKETVHRSSHLSLADGLRLEADLAALLQTTHDRAEGIAAFLERRSAHFEAR